MDMMDKLPGANVYESFAYHVSLLKDFSADADDDPMSSRLSYSGRRRVRQNSFTGSIGGKLTRDAQNSNGSVRSLRSVGAKPSRKAASQSEKKKSNKSSTTQSNGMGDRKNGTIGDGRMFGPRAKAPALERNVSVNF